jgi:hypothetical protein
MTDANSASIDLPSLVSDGASEWTLDPSASMARADVRSDGDRRLGADLGWVRGCEQDRDLAHGPLR